MNARACICAVLVTAVALFVACASVRAEECTTSDDCWEGLVCVGFPAECPGGCEPPKGRCERPCDEERLCGPDDTCSTQMIPVRAATDADNDPVRICLTPTSDAGIR